MKVIVVNILMNLLGKVLLNFIFFNFEFKQYDYYVIFILNIIKFEKLFEECVGLILFNDYLLNNVILLFKFIWVFSLKIFCIVFYIFIFIVF